MGMLPSIGCSLSVRLIPSPGKAKIRRKGTPGSLPSGSAAPFRTPQRTWYLERKNNPSFFIPASKDAGTILILLCLVKKANPGVPQSLVLDTDVGYHPLSPRADSHHGSRRTGLDCWLKPVRKTWKTVLWPSGGESREEEEKK